jgi:hypothetical protein
MKAITVTQGAVQELLRFLRNLEFLFEALALAICSIYNAWTLLNSNVSPFEHYVRLGSSFLIALVSAYHFVRFIRSVKLEV